MGKDQFQKRRTIIMPLLRNYHIMISHSWSYNAHYNIVCDWLNDAAYFYWSNYSVCCDNPLNTTSEKELKERLKNQISNSSCIVVLSGMYSAYSKWIDFEIDTAYEMNKPIIGVKPWGQERVPIKIQNKSNVMVGWNSLSVINAIRTYAI